LNYLWIRENLVNISNMFKYFNSLFKTLIRCRFINYVEYTLEWFYYLIILICKYTLQINLQFSWINVEIDQRSFITDKRKFEKSKQFQMLKLIRRINVEKKPNCLRYVEFARISSIIQMLAETDMCIYRNI